MNKYAPDDLVKSCPKLESGLRFGPEGVRACQLGPFAAPVYWNADEAAVLDITKEMIVKKRQHLFEDLNDPDKDVICKKCAMAETKAFKEVDFTKLGRIDHAPRTICNLRCEFCGFTKAEKSGDLQNGFVEPNYDSLAILKAFAQEDVQWDATVDFNGGETSLIKNIGAYLDYFNRMKIRVLLFTNSVLFKQEIYDGIANGAIQWVVTSIDCGTPSTYQKTKKVDAFGRVLEHVTRYAHAGSFGKGSLAIKYIFTENNCSDNDIYGFVYAMLAIRPQKIWLTFDFTPFGVIPPDADDFCGFNFDRQIAAYAKMYRLFRQHGQEVVHYTEGHLAKISKPGKILLQCVLDEIAKKPSRNSGGRSGPQLVLNDFRNHTDRNFEYTSITTQGERILDNLRGEHIDLKNKKVALAPATERSINWLSHPALADCKTVGFLDKNPGLTGKSIQGHKVSTYESVDDYDFVLITPPAQHKMEIISTVYRMRSEATSILVFD
jgi:hypothetical protein